MTRDPIQELVALTVLVRAAQAARIQRLREDELRIRADIDRLDDHRRDNWALSEGDLAGPRSIGGDMLWQAWTARARADFQMRLARTLAQQGTIMRRLRIAHGRCEAATGLSEQDARDRASRREKSRLAFEQGLFALAPRHGETVEAAPGEETA